MLCLQGPQGPWHQLACLLHLAELRSLFTTNGTCSSHRGCLPKPQAQHHQSPAAAGAGALWHLAEATHAQHLPMSNTWHGCPGWRHHLSSHCSSSCWPQRAAVFRPVAAMSITTEKGSDISPVRLGEVILRGKIHIPHSPPWATIPKSTFCDSSLTSLRKNSFPGGSLVPHVN